MKICPNCGKVLAYNSYFGAYICSNCNWEDSSTGKRRDSGIYSYSIQVKGNHKSKQLVYTRSRTAVTK